MRNIIIGEINQPLKLFQLCNDSFLAVSPSLIKKVIHVNIGDPYKEYLIKVYICGRFLPFRARVDFIALQPYRDVITCFYQSYP